MKSYGSTWAAGYRPDGLRAHKDNNGAGTYFLYDGGVPVEELDKDGNPTAINVFGADGLIGRKTLGSSGTVTEYLFDHQGNVAQRLDASNNVLSYSCYEAYGTEYSSSTPTDPFGYNAQSGYYLDRETGLYLCTFRYYDPANGRWINRDPIGYSGGMNLYGYCGGEPIGGSDPLGFGSEINPEYGPALFDALGDGTGSALENAEARLAGEASQSVTQIIVKGTSNAARIATIAALTALGVHPDEAERLWDECIVPTFENAMTAMSEVEGSGGKVNMLRHKLAERLSLQTGSVDFVEQSFFGRIWTRYGFPGSARPDVGWGSTEFPNLFGDFKFGPGGLSPHQIANWPLQLPTMKYPGIIIFWPE